MLYDLALNRDATDLMAMGYLSERDLQIRHNVFWGCYVYDKFVHFEAPLIQGSNV
jgi:hypothetical protein